MSAYHAKLEALGAYSDVHLLAVSPDYWVEHGRRHQAELVTPGSYRLEQQAVRLNGRFHLHWWPGLSRIVNSFQPDIVHIDEEPYNIATAHACRVSRGYGARLVFFAWQNIERSYPPPFSWFERYVFRHAAGIAGTATAAQVLQAKGFRRLLAVVPQFGVDPAIYRPGESRAHRSAFTIGYAGRLVPPKGIEVLLNAVRLLGNDSQLVIAGAGPLLDSLNQRAVKDPHLRVMGPVPSRDMPQFYQGLDVLVLPTIGRPGWTEQFGRAAVEAMACGVPVIVSDAGELPTVVGDAGVVVPAGHVEALHEALFMMQRQPDRRVRVGEAGRSYVLNTFANDHIAAATTDFYRRVLESDPV